MARGCVVSGDELVAGLERMATFAKAHGIDALVEKISAINTVDLVARRKAALFVVGLRDHGIVPSDFREQPYGLVAQCRRCQMVIRIQRDRTGIAGNALAYDCPSGRNDAAVAP